MKGTRKSNHTIKMLNCIINSTKGKPGYTVTMYDLVSIYANEYGYNWDQELAYLGLPKKTFQRFKNNINSAIVRYNDTVFDSDKIKVIQDNKQDRQKLYYV